MLDAGGIEVASERSTGKAPLSDDDARDLLTRAERVVIARGRSSRELAPSATGLDDLKGPSGKYRAPILLSGGTLLVGFNETVLGALLG